MPDIDKSHRFDSAVDKLKDRFREEPVEPESMLEHEAKANQMAIELRAGLSKIAAKENHVKWAVRTSMDDIKNFAAISDTFDDLSQRTGITESESDELASNAEGSRQLGDQLDQESPNSAYVVVEFSIDYKRVPYPKVCARQFFLVLKRAVGKHNPDEQTIVEDSLEPFAYMDRVAQNTSSVSFTGRYRFLGAE